MRHVTIEIDGWRASTGYAPVTDDDGTQWVLQGLAGWWDQRAVRAAPEDRLHADGAHDGTPLLGAQRIVATGTAIASSREGAARAMERVGSLLSWPRYGTLTVDEPGLGMARVVDRVRLDEAQPTVERVTPFTVSWSVPLFAADPLRYSATWRSAIVAPYKAGEGRRYDLVFPREYGGLGASGSVTVTNRGRVPVYPRITIEGFASNPRVTLVGVGAIEYIGDVWPGEPLVIDMRERSAMVAGANQRWQISARSVWWAMPPGESRLVMDAGGDSGSALVEWRDAY